MNSEILIRRYNWDDLKVLLDMTKKEGWDVSHVDCKASLEVDANGLLVAEDSDGAPVGFIGPYNLLPGMTYVDTFIVKKDLRGKGIGKQLWSAMLNATKGNILIIDGISEMKKWYTEHGFHYEAYGFKFCKGTVTSMDHVTNNSPYDVVPVSDDIWPALLAYDMQMYPYPRETALRAWIRGTDTYSVVALNDKTVVGYANFHWKSDKECNIKVLYGDDKGVADALLVNLLQQIPIGSEVSFNLCGDKPMPKYLEAVKCLFTAHRLYTQEIPGIQTDKMFFCGIHLV